MRTKLLKAFLIASLLLTLAGCSSDSGKSSKDLPTREGGSDLPWNRPASWEGGLPGMGGIGTPTRY